MNENPTPSRPDDDASDPLLTALRQHLGGYGEAPPPGAWAGIRQRLPTAAARPWWQTRRLLPLLAVLLGLVAATGLLVRRLGQSETTVAASRTGRTATRPAAPAAGSAVPTPGSGLTQVTTSVSRADKQAYSATNADTAASATVGHGLPRAALTGREAGGRATGHAGRAGSVSPAGRRAAPAGEPLTAAAGSRQTKRPTRLRRGLPPGPATSRELSSRRGRLAAGGAVRRPVAARRRPASRALAATQQLGLPARLEKASALRNTSRAAARRNPLEPKPGATVAGRSLASGRKKPTRMTSSTSLDSPGFNQTIDSLGFGAAVLALAPRLALPAPLAAGAEPSRPPYPPVRRWALLAVAGPTLSYRTIGPAPATITGRPDFAHLERPAAGLGAQVQARRMLTGRWALAVGVGYQEYATRLALQPADSGAAPIHQRDTYRLLTLPVQLSYALGAPRGRLAKGPAAGGRGGLVPRRPQHRGQRLRLPAANLHRPGQPLPPLEPGPEPGARFALPRGRPGLALAVGGAAYRALRAQPVCAAGRGAFAAPPVQPGRAHWFFLGHPLGSGS